MQLYKWKYRADAKSPDESDSVSVNIKNVLRTELEFSTCEAYLLYISTNHTLFVSIQKAAHSASHDGMINKKKDIYTHRRTHTQMKG